MRIVHLLCLLFVCSFSLLSQQQNPIVWASSYKAISATEGEIIILGSIQSGWHTYSQRPTEAGPISTIIKFTPSGNYELIGKTEEIDVHEEYDKAFEAKLFVFSNKAEFKQKIKIKSKSAIVVTIEFVCCNDNMCLPPKTIELSVKIP
jgi:hypothetical protein